MTYKDLKSFQQATIISDFTVEFCKLYIDPKSRTTDQMVQAARSGKQNITEGSTVSKTSPKSELMLLGVAKGSLKELLEDYEDFLRQKRLEKWGKDDPRAMAARQLTYQNKANRSDMTYKTYESYLPKPEQAANAMVTLINQTTYLLDQQIKAIERQMEAKGISKESYQQKASRIITESRNKEQKFNRILEGIREGKNKPEDLYDV